MNKVTKCHRCCILCLKSPIKVPGLRLHRFPANEVKRNVWLNACGLKVNEYLPSRRICSRHFDETCYSESGSLKRDSIPTKCLKGQIIQPFFSLLKPKNGNSSIFEDDLSTLRQSSSKPDLSPSLTSELHETSIKEKHFINEIKIPDLSAPLNAKKSCILAESQIRVQTPKITFFNQKVQSNSMVNLIKNQEIFDNHEGELMEQTQQTLEYYITLHHLNKIHTLNNKG